MHTAYDESKLEDIQYTYSAKGMLDYSPDTLKKEASANLNQYSIEKI